MCVVVLHKRGESESRSAVSDSLWPHGLYMSELLQRPEYWSKCFPSPGGCPTQGSNTGLLNCMWILCQLSHKGSTEQERIFLELVAQLPTSFLEIETISFLLESKQNISRREKKNGIRGFIILDYEHGSRGKSWEQGKDIDILCIYYSLSISFAQKAQTMQKYWEIKRKLSPIRFSIFPIDLIIFLTDHYSDL